MNQFTLKSPAKVNLYLEVLRKRKDGFHEIETVFERINLFDTLRVKKIKKGIKILSSGEIPLGRENLAYQAAEKFLRRFNLPWGVEIRIVKRIPVAAGLGGASSNAASVLLALNRISGLNLEKEKLSSLAKEIGSDVNFFLAQKARAIGRGRGELIAPLKAKRKLHLVLVNPGLEIKSKWVYQRLRLGLTRPRDDVKILLRALEKSDLDGLSDALFNRLEEVVLPHAKIIVRIKEALNSLGIRAVLMSGSGSSVFGIVGTGKEAKDLAQALSRREKKWRTFALETLV